MKLQYICKVLLMLKLITACFCETDPQGHVEPVCNYPPFQNVATMDDFPTPEYFFRWLTEPGQPVIFKSVLETFEFPAYKKWTDDYLREKFGETVVQTDNSRRDIEYFDSLKMKPLKQFLNDYKQRDQYLVHVLQEDMKEDVRVPRSLHCGGFQNLFDQFVMWFSSGGTKSYLHNDEYDNINCILDGVKQFKLIDKKYSDQIKARNYNHDLGYSPLDIDKVDMNQYPNLRDLPWIEARVEKGDCMFLPKDWFHLVYSQGERNLAVNLWFVPLPWFNATDCDHRVTHSEATKYKVADKIELIKRLLIHTYRDMKEIRKENIDLILLEAARKERNRNRVMEYLDVNKDGVISWPELLPLNMKDFLKKFIDILMLPPHLDDLKINLRKIKKKKSDSVVQSENQVKGEL